MNRLIASPKKAISSTLILLFLTTALSACSPTRSADVSGWWYDQRWESASK